MISTAGDAALTVSDPGHLMNGTFALPSPLVVEFSKATWTAPVSNDLVTIAFKQHVGATDALRTGRVLEDVDLHAVDDNALGQGGRTSPGGSEGPPGGVSGLSVGLSAAPRKLRRMLTTALLAEATTAERLRRADARRIRFRADAVAVEFLILGPLEIRHDGRPLASSAARAGGR